MKKYFKKIFDNFIAKTNIKIVYLFFQLIHLILESINIINVILKLING
jgi:uncharacterized membrane protein YozB (DUF420 family)